MSRPGAGGWPARRPVRASPEAGAGEWGDDGGVTDPRSDAPASPRPPDLTLSRTLAWLTDDLVRVPGTDLGVGLDAVIGLVPGIGDVLGTGLSGVLMVDAVRHRVPLPVLARMGGNLLLDAVLGLLPVVGDAADVAHRANRKNLRLLEDAVAAGRRVETDVQGYLVRAAAIVVGSVAAALVVAGFVVWGLLRVLGVVG